MFVSGGSGNRVQGGSGTDTLQAIGGGNTLIGGRGTELLIAFNNSNVLFAGSGNASLEVGGNGNVLLGGTGADAFGASGNGNALQAGTAAAQMTVTGNGNVLLGGSGADRLVVTSGSGDKLVAGSGTDTLADGGTQGFYDFGRGDGQAAIVNGAAGAVAPSNELDFGANITDQNLWFVQSGNNLQIDLMGTTSAATVDGWFSGAGHQLQEITAGGLKLDSQVAQLVQAMATFQNNHPAFNPTGAAAAPNDPTLQATIAAAWHH